MRSCKRPREDAPLAGGLRGEAKRSQLYEAGDETAEPHPHEPIAATPAAVLLLEAPGAQLLEHDFRQHAALLHAAAEECAPLLEQRPRVIMWGKEQAQPRDVGFFSDVTEGYAYAGRVMRAQPLAESMRQLLQVVNETFSSQFNGVLANRYRSGSDTVGSHSDSEIGLEPRAGVVALSLGATRTFRVRSAATKEILRDVPAREGFGLQMRGDRFQKVFKHEIPAQLRVKEARMSLTFRKHTTPTTPLGQATAADGGALGRD
jgi:alkylated DNA repair dioxygenase AlkB